VDAIVASVLRLVRLVRVDDGHIGSATALGVLDCGTGSLARRTVLAARSIRHGIVKLQITVEFGRNLELSDRGLVNTLALVTADLGAAVPVFGSLSRNAFGLEASSSEFVSLAELLRARISRILETLVTAEVAKVQIAPVEALGHVRGAVIVRVVRRAI
jgi:hypothetical protein